jgi:predicted outer membrane repeat protein
VRNSPAVISRLYTLVFLTLVAPSAQAVCYVSTAGISSNTGTSWSAPLNLQTALGNPLTCNEIWVKKGVYKPSSSDQTTSFNIRPGVAVYGGFDGSETTRNQRDPPNNVTVLSGDIDHNDFIDSNGVTENATDIAGYNSYHVVFMDGTGSTPIIATTILDGFTITGGDAAGGSGPPFSYYGGGIYCYGEGSGKECSPTLSNLTFCGNETVSIYGGLGGAIYNDGTGGGTSSPTITNVVFSGNRTNQYGGAIHNDGTGGGASNPTITNVTFSGNSSYDGGAMTNTSGAQGSSSPILTNVTFINNTARNGGAIYDDAELGGYTNPTFNNVNFIDNSAGLFGGAIYAYASGATSSPTLSDVTFRGNSAGGNGGGMYTELGGAGTNSPTLGNVTFSGNRASFGGAMFTFGSSPKLNNVTISGNLAGEGGAMDNSGGSPTLTNVILWGDGAGPEIHNYPGTTPTIAYSVVQGSGGSGAGWTGLGTAGGGNLDADPKLGILQINGGSTETMLPGAGSSAIDVGDDSVCAAAPVNGLDQRGVTRPQGTHCDIGSVEALPNLIFANGFE